MNKTIQNLFKELETIRGESQERVSQIESKLQDVFNKVFDNDKGLEAALTNLESASMYDTDRYGEIYRWYRYSGLDDIAIEARPYLEVYLSNHCVHVDWDNGCLQSFEGDAIVINDDGDIFLGSKLIIDSSAYETESERNSLIEAYMERTGYFPGVFTQDRHGNVFAVNTQQVA